MYDIQHYFICRPSHSIVSEDAGIEPRTVATTALAVKRSTIRLDLIHDSARSRTSWVSFLLCTHVDQPTLSYKKIPLCGAKNR
jgi:hypothetical protein